MVQAIKVLLKSRALTLTETRRQGDGIGILPETNSFLPNLTNITHIRSSKGCGIVHHIKSVRQKCWLTASNASMGAITSERTPHSEGQALYYSRCLQEPGPACTALKKVCWHTLAILHSMHTLEAEAGGFQVGDQPEEYRKKYLKTKIHV